MHMAKKKPFLLVSLEEKKARDLAKVMNNATCKKMLDYFASNPKVTETELAQKLNIPISTVHYNLKHLTNAKLVESKEYSYSTKGKEVNHYTLANRFVVIAPQHAHTEVMTKLKSIFSTLGIVVGVGMIYSFMKQKVAVPLVQQVPTLTEAAPKAKIMQDEAASIAVRTTADAMPTASQAAPEMMQEAMVAEDMAMDTTMQMQEVGFDWSIVAWVFGVSLLVLFVYTLIEAAWERWGK
jgi:predicted transcriptional regulator